MSDRAKQLAVDAFERGYWHGDEDATEPQTGAGGES